MNKVFGIFLVGLVLAIGSASSPSIAGNRNQNETGFTLYDTWDIPTDAKPNLRTLEVYLRKHLNDPTSRGRGKYEIKGSENPYEFKSKKKSNAFLTKQMNTTALLSYLYWDDGYILYDEITSKKD